MKKNFKVGPNLDDALLSRNLQDPAQQEKGPGRNAEDIGYVMFHGFPGHDLDLLFPLIH